MVWNLKSFSLGIFLFLGMTFSLVSVAFPSSFEGERDFLAIPLEGSVFVTCNEGGRSESQWMRCRANLLSPTGAFAKFQVDVDEPFDSVELRSQQSSGNIERKTVEWDSGQNSTAKAVNLWVDSLLQDPLLDYGVNRIQWALTRPGRRLEGTLNVSVQSSSGQVCQDGREFSNRLSDCRGYSTLICDRYFNRRNLCQ